jgi:hypothetical protein
VLALGLWIEKGFEDRAAATKETELMVRGSWDWPGLADRATTVMDDVARCGEDLGRPVNGANDRASARRSHARTEAPDIRV